MNTESLRAQLFAIRAQVDALLMQLEPPPAAEPAAGDGMCPHPPQARRDLSVMGGPERWECRACGHEETVTDVTTT